MLFAISSKFDGRWERILLSQFLKTSCIESFHLVELFCKFMTFLSWLMGFGKIILHQKGAVMNSFYFFSYLFRFVHFFLKFAPMGCYPSRFQLRSRCPRQPSMFGRSSWVTARRGHRVAVFIGGASLNTNIYLAPAACSAFRNKRLHD